MSDAASSTITVITIAGSAVLVLIVIGLITYHFARKISSRRSTNKNHREAKVFFKTKDQEEEPKMSKANQVFAWIGKIATVVVIVLIFLGAYMEFTLHSFFEDARTVSSPPTATATAQTTPPSLPSATVVVPR
ncbi:hypothetical protein HY439_00700 [Candidatus Microgenomates bacterium]|nr:hypothetical protein [Candidatus Microgenomates bacterium]